MLSTSQNTNHDESQASIQREDSPSHTQSPNLTRTSVDEHSHSQIGINTACGHSSFVSTDGSNASSSSTDSRVARSPALPDSPRRGEDKPISLINAFFSMIEMGRVEGFRHIFYRMKKLNKINIKWPAADPTRIIASYYAEGSTALINACRFIQPEIVQILLEESDDLIDVQACNAYGRDALMTAVAVYLRLAPTADGRKADAMNIIYQLLDKKASFLYVSPDKWSVFAILLYDINQIAQHRELINIFVEEFYDLILEILEKDCSQFYDLIQDLHDPEKSDKFYSLYTAEEIKGYTSCFMNALSEFIEDDQVAGRYGDRLKQFMLDYFYRHFPSKPQSLNIQTTSSSVSSSPNNGDNAASCDAYEAQLIRQRSQMELAQRQIMLLNEADQLMIRLDNIQAHLKHFQNNNHSLLWDYRNPVPAASLIPLPTTEDVTVTSFIRNSSK